MFKQNRMISMSYGLVEFWCLGLPVALGRGQVDGEHLGAWGCPHTCTFIHV